MTNQTNRADLLKDAKPILFNTAMVKAILEGKKRCTRRLANISTGALCFAEQKHEFIRDDFDGGVYTGYVCKHCGYGVTPPHCRRPVGTSFLRPMYNVGDTLYVRETWRVSRCEMCDNPKDEYQYLASVDSRYKDVLQWKPSIHMPKAAARIFLRVTDVRLERLQDIMDDPPGPDNQVVREGCTYGCDFIAVWQNTIPKEKLSDFGWDANPWVWVYEFERVI